MPRQYEKTHSRTVRATVDIPAYRFVNRNGGLGGIGVLGVSESAARAGDDVALITGYSALVEAATPIAAGDIIDTDSTGRAVGKPSGIGLGIAESAAGAGEPFEARLGLVGGDPASVVTASVNPLTGGSTFLESAARNPDSIIVGDLTRNADGAVTSASVMWPDGVAGTYTALVLSSSFPGAVDSYAITHGAQTYTQPTVTRNADGAVTIRPGIEVA